MRSDRHRRLHGERPGSGSYQPFVPTVLEPHAEPLADAHTELGTQPFAHPLAAGAAKPDCGARLGRHACDMRGRPRDAGGTGGYAGLAGHDPC